MWESIENFGVIGWLLLFVILYFLARLFEQAWLFRRQSFYKEAIEWVVLEIKIPREVEKTPRSMEQFFMNLHGLMNAPNDFMEKYFDGEVTLWWSMEIASFGGEVHLYIRTPKKHKKVTEAALYAQYQSVEIYEVEDYMDSFPRETREVYKKGYNIFGSEIILRKDDFYPIMSYENFELDKNEMALDPISALIEVLANIHKEEIVFLQFLIRPTGTEWQEAGKKIVEELTLKKKEKNKKSGFGGGFHEWFKNFFWAPIEHPSWLGEKEIKEEKFEFGMFKLTPGEADTIKAIEKSLSKQGFDSLIRYLYYSPNSIFSTNFARRGLLGALNQYASQNLNSFRSNYSVETRTKWIYYPYVFVKQRVEAKKQRVLYNYQNRKFPEKLAFGKFFTSHIFNFNNKSKNFILNTAEIATLFHIPTETVLTAPHIKRAESKKMGPPAGLPIFKE